MSTSPSGTPSWLKWLIQNTSVPGITILIAVIVYQKTGNFSYVVYVLIGGAIIFGLLALFKDFMGSVWEELKKKWSLPVADWIHNKVTNIVSPYRKKYLQHLVYRYRDFDVKGLSTQGTYNLALEKVFVELSVDPRSLHSLSTDPLNMIPEELRQGSHQIWDYLQAEPAEEQPTRHLAVIGAPGSGKTTLLCHMTLILAGKKDKPLKKLPILLFLRDHAVTIQQNPDLSLSKAVHDHLAKWEMPAPPKYFEHQLDRGNCLIMLDGLDEIADPKIRKAIVTWVEKQMKTHAQNQFVITSRPFGYRSNPLSGVTVLEVRPFSQQQVQKFVHNWYLANEIMAAKKNDPGVYMKAREGAGDLLRRLRGLPALAELAINPLLLTMIATVHRYRSSLPGRRVELYAEICEVFLGKRQQARGLELVLTPAKKQRVLQPLAYEMMCREVREIKASEAAELIKPALALVSDSAEGSGFLKMIENSSGLLIERENGVYSFSHLTFQEYLAAVHVRVNQLGDELMACVGESWWHETIRLYAAQEDATPIIAACLPTEKLKPASLVLAVQCLDEALEVKPNVKQRLQRVLQEGVEDDDATVRKGVAEALLMLRLQQMSRVDDDLYVDNGLITHAEYQLFLDEKREQGEFYQPDHWQTFQFKPGEGHDVAVGMRPTDAEAFCKWLTQREDGIWQYRLLQGVEVASYPADEPVKQTGYWIREGNQIVLEMAGKLLPTISKTILEQRRARDLASEPALARALARARDLARDHALSLARALARARALALARDLARALDLDLALARALDLDLDLDLARDSKKRHDYRVYIRVMSLTIAGLFADFLARQKSKGWTQRVFQGSEEKEQQVQLQALIDNYLDLYLDFVILEERIEGNLTAVEGIRIIRERIKE